MTDPADNARIALLRADIAAGRGDGGESDALLLSLLARIEVERERSDALAEWASMRERAEKAEAELASVGDFRDWLCSEVAKPEDMATSSHVGVVAKLCIERLIRERETAEADLRELREAAGAYMGAEDGSATLGRAKAAEARLRELLERGAGT